MFLNHKLQILHMYTYSMITFVTTIRRILYKVIPCILRHTIIIAILHHIYINTLYYIYILLVFNALYFIYTLMF